MGSRGIYQQAARPRRQIWKIRSGFPRTSPVPDTHDSPLFLPLMPWRAHLSSSSPEVVQRTPAAELRAHIRLRQAGTAQGPSSGASHGAAPGAPVPVPGVPKDDVVPLEEQEVIRLEAILVDRDEVAALEYLRKVVMQKIEQQRQAHCKPRF